MGNVLTRGCNCYISCSCDWVAFQPRFYKDSEPKNLSKVPRGPGVGELIWDWLLIGEDLGLGAFV